MLEGAGVIGIGKRCRELDLVHGVGVYKHNNDGFVMGEES